MPRPWPPPAQWRVVPLELEQGDRPPDYHFTNELGQAVSLSGFQGGVAVFTFFFTRCPYPTACPLLASKFSQVLEKLPQSPGAPARWRLLSISFDPANDTPAILKEYAQSCHYDPARWSFLTGSLADLTDLADRCGEHFQITGETIVHDFRTVVVDPSGRVRKIIPGNSWTSDDLIREILNAARCSRTFRSLGRALIGCCSVGAVRRCRAAASTLHQIKAQLPPLLRLGRI
jgi:protein SCO1/2